MLVEEKAKLRREIVELLERWHPASVAELKTILLEKRKKNLSYTELDVILSELKHERKLELKVPEGKMSGMSSLTRGVNFDFWLIMIGTLILLLTLSEPQNALLAPPRWVLGGLMALVFPGYATLMTLFPMRSGLLFWQRILISVGLSIALIGFYATILDATSPGIILTTVFAVLATHTIIFALVGLLRRAALR